MNGLLMQPKNTMPRIDEIWAFVSVDPNDGNEGIIAQTMGDTWMPFVAADKARLDALRPIVEHLVHKRGITVKLVKFTQREEIETLESNEKPG